MGFGSSEASSCVDTAASETSCSKNTHDQSFNRCTAAVFASDLLLWIKAARFSDVGFILLAAGGRWSSLEDRSWFHAQRES